MSYTLHFVADNLIFQIITGNYIESEIKSASQEMADFMDKAGRDCYVLVDLSKMKAIESNIVLVKNAVRPLLSHSRLKLILAYGTSDSAVINFMAGFMASLFKIPVKTLGKQEDAIRYLINKDPSLDGKIQDKLRGLAQESV